jgi:hypothetical protein
MVPCKGEGLRQVLHLGDPLHTARAAAVDRLDDQIVSAFYRDAFYLV